MLTKCRGIHPKTKMSYVCGSLLSVPLFFLVWQNRNLAVLASVLNKTQEYYMIVYLIMYYNSNIKNFNEKKQKE